MSEFNELTLFDFHTHPSDSDFYAPTQLDDVEYHPFRSGGRDGLIWSSQGIWLMVEAAAKIVPGGLVIGERRRLLLAAAGFAPDPESGRMTPLGPLAAEYTDTDELPEAVVHLVTSAAQHYARLGAEAQP